MRTPEGGANLCPGCPLTGSFVGAVTAASVHTSPENGGWLYLRDADGQTSYNLVKQGGGRLDNAARIVEAAADPSLKAALVGRIRRCVGYVDEYELNWDGNGTLTTRYCPALNGHVLEALTGSPS